MTTATLTQDPGVVRARLETHVRRAVLRMRLQEALHAGVFSISLALWLLVPMAFIDRLFGFSQIGYDLWVVWLGILALCLPYVLIRALSDKIDERLAAALTDERLGLNSRLCTALALNPHDDSQFSLAFYEEAGTKLERLDPTNAFPIVIPRLAHLMPIPALIATGIYFFMQPQDKLGLVATYENKKRAENTKLETARQLDKRLEDLKEKYESSAMKDTAPAEVKHLLKEAQEIAKKVKENKSSAEEAIVSMADLKRKIEEQRDELQKGKSFLDRLKQAELEKLELEDSAAMKQVADALKNGDANLAAREMRKLARTTRKEILENDQLSAEQKEVALKKLQRDLEKLAGALAEQESLKDKLQELSQQNFEPQDFQALEQELKDFQNRQGDSAADKLQERMDDIADELERLDEENESELSEEEEELLEALDGLEEELATAMESMGECLDGSCKGSGKSGKPSQDGSGQRASRSGRMSSQQNRTQRSGSSNQGRNSAQGNQGRQNNGQQGGESARQSQQPGQGQSGGPGQGLRPYRDGDAEFKVEKVRGQMQSGAITGLSHFRGEGGKGPAPQNYIKALEAADKEATSSLELDRIPADARNTVKNYFSSLKQDLRPIEQLRPNPAEKEAE